MSNTTLSLQTHGLHAHLTNAEKKAASLPGVGGASLAQQASMSSSVELNGEDFVLLPVNGRTPAFKTNPANRLAPGSTGTTVVNAYKAERHVENEFQSTFATSLMSALFPVSGLMETLRHFMEVTHKLSEGNSLSMKLSETQNINPRDAINPNKAFIPSTPFAIPTKPTMELWQQRRLTTKEEEAKKKKKVKGLGAF